MSTLKCKLKKETKDGTYILSVKREHGKEFVLTDVPDSAIPNLKRFCDVEIIDSGSKDKNLRIKEVEVIKDKSDADIAAEKELMQFATDVWDLALEQAKTIDKLEKKLGSAKPAKAKAKAPARKRMPTSEKKE